MILYKKIYRSGGEDSWQNNGISMVMSLGFVENNENKDDIKGNM